MPFILRIYTLYKKFTDVWKLLDWWNVNFWLKLSIAWKSTEIWMKYDWQVLKSSIPKRNNIIKYSQDQADGPAVWICGTIIQISWQHCEEGLPIVKCVTTLNEKKQLGWIFEESALYLERCQLQQGKIIRFPDTKSRCNNDSNVQWWTATKGQNSHSSWGYLPSLMGLAL